MSFVVLVEYRKGGADVLGPFATRDEAINTVLNTRKDWSGPIKEGWCDPEAGFWGDEENSYTIKEMQNASDQCSR